MNETKKTISIIGDGGWGTALAIHLSRNSYPVKLWSPSEKYASILKKTRINKKFLPGFVLPESIEITGDLKLAIENTSLIVLAIPSAYLKNILKKIRPLSFRSLPFLSAVKGINTRPVNRVSEMIFNELGKIDLAVLSGPTIASEVAKGLPSSAVVASKNISLANKIQKIFNSSLFRIYTNSDMIGVEIGGSIKNIVAIACGVCDGLGFGTNTKAALVTRGLNEMTVIGQYFGAQKKTFFGLSGLGDLATTCFNPKSRNHNIGFQIAKGKTINQITSSMAMVAEGITTVKAVYHFAKKNDLAMPITNEVFHVLYLKKDPLIAVNDLMMRKNRSE